MAMDQATATTRRGTQKRRMQPAAAARALRTLLADPDDTAQVFHILRALTGDSFERLYQRVLRDPGGRRILEATPSLLPLLQNRDALRSLPPASLGAAYARFVDAEQLSADGLVEASEEGADDRVFLDARARVLSERLRDAHDLWHVVTGYGRDLLGEGALLAFTAAQVRNPGLVFIVVAGMAKLWSNGHREAPRIFWGGFVSGLKAASLPCAEWEALASRPLDEVRRELGIAGAPDYQPVFSAAAGALH